MKFTGERLHADERMGNGAIQHLHRYAFAQRFIKPGDHVLDIASGEGYGTNLFAQIAGKTYGVDISAEAVRHAASKYQRPNLQFLEGSATAIPLPDASLDVLVSFETLEHHPYHTEMMIEVKRVLKPSGILIISTPEKDNYHPIDPDNEFHVKELTGTEFETLIKNYFSYMKMFRQRSMPVSLLYVDSLVHNDIQLTTGNFSKLEPSVFAGAHLFNVAIASNEPIIVSEDLHVFDGTEIMRVYDIFLKEHYIDMLEDLRTSRIYRLGDSIAKPFRALKNIFGK
jgi:ubiquinone/menaquinone biosynthesis C-methylase UbiE